MSCIVQKSENTAALADWITRLLNNGYSFAGMEAPESLFRALNDCRDDCGFFRDNKVYNALSELNLAAYNGRYRENNSYYPKYKRNQIMKRVEYSGGHNGHYIVEDWHYKIFKMLSFFVYQCCEDVTHNVALYKALEELKTSLALFIAFNSEQCAAVDWE